MSGYQIEFGELDIRLREPQGAASGALILNHGRGADENDLYPVLEALDPERRLLGITTGAPIRNLPPGGRHWYVVERVGYPHPETFGRSYGLLTERLDGILAEREIDWSQTAIGGFSQGTVMSYALALGPGRPTPAALLALSGFIPEVEGWQVDLSGRGDLRTLIHHGANDPVISVDFARAARDRLQGAGLEVDYLETSAAHGLPPEILPRLQAALEPLTTADRN